MCGDGGKSQRQWLWLYLEAGEEGTEGMFRAQLYHLVYEWFGEREIRGGEIDGGVDSDDSIGSPVGTCG